MRNNLIDIYSKHRSIFDKTRHHCMKGYKDAVHYKENILFELLLKLRDEQIIIYCSSPKRVRELSRKFCKFLENKQIEHSIKVPLIEWIEKNVNKEWDLVKSLKRGIGIHDGALEKHITTSIITCFN